MGDFLKNAVRCIREQARTAQRTRDYEFIGLAAHLFAIASLILSEEGSARVEMADRILRSSELGKPVESLQEVLFRLATLPESTEAPELYMTLVTALQILEGELLACPVRERSAVVGKTKLSGRSLGEVELSGTVLHWLRPESLLAIERDLRYEQAKKRAPDPAPHPITFLRQLGMFWQRGGDSAKLKLPSGHDPNIPLILRSGREALHHERFRIALCPLPGDFRPQFEVTDDERGFRALPEGMVDRQGLREHLEALIEEAAAEEIHLLVLPELTVDAPARSHLSDLLRRNLREHPFGVIAGSFHVWREGEGLPVNEALLLDEMGNSLLKHWKKGRYRLSSRHITSHFFPGKRPAGDIEVLEDIRWGNTLEILETRLGRLAVLVCADGIEKNAYHGFEQVVEQIRPDLTFIVSMSKETRPFANLMESLSRAWVGVFFVNAHCLFCVPDAPPPAGELLAGCNLALHEDTKMPATRFRWCHDAAGAECIYFHPEDGNKDWRLLDPAPQPGRPREAFLLERNGKRLALVVDVGLNLKKVKEKRKNQKKTS